MQGSIENFFLQLRVIIYTFVHIIIWQAWKTSSVALSTFFLLLQLHSLISIAISRSTNDYSDYMSECMLLVR